MSEQEDKARIIAEGYLLTTKPGNDWRSTQLAKAKDPKKRSRFLRRMSKRFAKVLFAKAQFDGSPIALKECEFMVNELFATIDDCKPIELIGMMKMLGDWAGFRKSDERERQKGPSIPRVSFKPVPTKVVDLPVKPPETQAQ